MNDPILQRPAADQQEKELLSDSSFVQPSSLLARLRDRVAAAEFARDLNELTAPFAASIESIDVYGGVPRVFLIGETHTEPSHCDVAALLLERFKPTCLLWEAVGPDGCPDPQCAILADMFEGRPELRASFVRTLETLRSSEEAKESSMHCDTPWAESLMQTSLLEAPAEDRKAVAAAVELFLEQEAELFVKHLRGDGLRTSPALVAAVARLDAAYELVNRVTEINLPKTYDKDVERTAAQNRLLETIRDVGCEVAPFDHFEAKVRVIHAYAANPTTENLPTYRNNLIREETMRRILLSRLFGREAAEGTVFCYGGSGHMDRSSIIDELRKQRVAFCRIQLKSPDPASERADAERYAKALAGGVLSPGLSAIRTTFDAFKGIGRFLFDAAREEGDDASSLTSAREIIEAYRAGGGRYGSDAFSMALAALGDGSERGQ